MINELNQLVQQAKETINETNIGKIPELLNLKRLRRDLIAIQKDLPQDRALPINFHHEEAFKIFKYARTGAIKIGKLIIIEIKIPIATKEKFYLHKITPIPLKVKEKTFYIESTSTYVLLNENETELIQITEKQMENSIQIDRNEILLKPNSIIKKRQDKMQNNNIIKANEISKIGESDEKICEWEVLLKPSIENILNNCKVTQIPNGNYIIEVIENNIYYASISKEENMNKICGEATFPIIMRSDTLIENKNNCKIEGRNFVIHSRNKYSVNGTQSKIISYPSELISEEECKRLTKIVMFNVSISKPKLIKSTAMFKELIKENSEIGKEMNHTLNFKKVNIEPVASNLWPDLNKLNPFKAINANKIIIILVLFMAILIIIKCVKCKKCGKKEEQQIMINLTELARKHKSTPEMKRRNISSEAEEGKEDKEK